MLRDNALLKNKNKPKRTRTTYFTFSEKELLLKYSVENKKSNTVPRKNKNKFWLKITEEYTSLEFEYTLI